MLSRLLIAGTAIVVCAVAVYFLFRAPANMPAVTLVPETTDSADQSVTEVKAGYVGVAKFGAWRLICSANGPAAPQDAAAAGTAIDPATQTSGNACRINQEIPVAGKPDQVLLAANFGVLGAMHRPALMLRLPPTVHAGDVITMRIDDSHTLRTPVRNCTDKECVAAASLSDDDWDELLAASTVEIAFPIADNQRILVDLPMNGLPDATAAMTVAQSTPGASPSASPTSAPDTTAQTGTDQSQAGGAASPVAAPVPQPVGATAP